MAIQKRQPIPVKTREPLSLPTEPTPPEEDIESYTLALYGAPKIGKTSFVAEFNDPFFLMFEPGGKGLTIKRRQIGKWEEFQGYVKLILASSDFRTIVIDTVDLAYESCTNYVVAEAGEDNVNEGSLGYGKGVDRVDAEFKKQILLITSTGRGIVFISHATEQEYEEATGVKYSKIIPSMKPRARRFINGFADTIAYYGYFGSERFLVVQGNDKLDAGHRIQGHFQTPKGEPINSIPMGDTPTEGYNNYINAYANKQTEQHILKRKADLGEKKVSFLKKR